jgi:FAS-associated factor 2
MDTLTSDEEQLVHEFISISNYPYEPHTAIQFLQANNWNLELALIYYFEHSPEASQQLNENSRRALFPGSIPDSNGHYGSNVGEQAREQAQEQARIASQQIRQSSSLGSLFSSIRNRVQSAIHRNNQYISLSSHDDSGYFQLGSGNKFFYFCQILFYTPIFSIYKITEILFLTLSKILSMLRKITTRYSQNRHSSKSQPKGIEPSHIARNFISDFNTYYRNDDRIDFFEGGYTSALYITKRDARFLVVYLHSDEHDSTNQFVHETLLSPQTLKFFRDHNILVWGGDVHESEAYQVSNALNVTKYPYLGLLCLKSNTQETPEGTTSTAPALTCVSRVQGLVSPNNLIEKFSGQIERLEPSLISIREERQQQELSRVIREQQDQAYQASLQRDRQIAEQRRQEILLAENKEQYLKWRLSTLLPEVDSTLKGNYARIAVRLANGEKISRRFDKDAKLEEIYAFTELYQKGLLNNPIQNVERPSDFVYPYGFRLISPMPRAEIAPSLDISVKDESSIWPNGNLIVEDI